MLRLAAIAVAAALLLAGCTSSRETSPERTATEQLLISTAADRAAEQVTLALPRGAKVYVDSSNLDREDGRYAVAAMRVRLLELGAGLVADRRLADIVVEVRSGALSTDENKTLVGIPGFDIPVPLGPSGLRFPEIALFKRDTRQGVARLAAVGYDARTGELISASEPRFGFAHRTSWAFLILASWTTDDIKPSEEEDVFYIEPPQVIGR